MKFKVGDRVEAIKGPSNTGHSAYIGPGMVTEVRYNSKCDEDYALSLDMGEEGWWFAEESLRPIRPTPSITVGTQVRLTGVVSEFRGSEVVVNVGDGRMNTSICLNPHYFEVIRRPFKRGEIIYHVGDKDSEPRTVVRDEAEGFVLLARHVHGTEVLEWDATSYERRP